MTCNRFSATVTRRTFATLAAGAVLAVGLTAVTPVRAEDPIRIGELNSYSRFAAFTVPYRQGFELALDEINAAGGVNGRTIEVISRDDGAATGDAVRVAEELVSREKVAFIFGTFLSNVGLAVGDFANQNKTLFIAAEPLTDALTMAKGNRYTFRLRANTWMQVGMLVDAVRESGAKRWAIVAPNYEYGQSSAENFKALAAAAIPGFELVAEQYPALGKIDAGATVSALEQAKPDGIFNALFGGDLAQFVREGTTRGLFEGRTVASLLTGEPEWMLPLKDEAPEGWIVTGYPWEQIEDAPHKAFVDAYQAKYSDTPRLGSLLGYQLMYMIRDMLAKAGSTDTEAMIGALEGLQMDTVAGPVTMRAADHQATMGAWVGKLTVHEGKGRMVDWKYDDGAGFMHTEEAVKATRPN
jgi:branched-chain amino acid transport system substrate-binding protein